MEKLIIFLFITLYINISSFSQIRDTLNFVPNTLLVSFKSYEKLDLKFDNKSKEFISNKSELNIKFKNFKIKKIYRYAPDIKDIELEKVFEIKCDCNELELSKELEKFTDIINYAERIPIESIDEYYPNDYDASALWHLEKIQAPKAWEIILGSTLIPIGITDTGYDTLHQDLKNKIIHMNGDVWYLPTTYLSHHGTAVAGMAAMETDNDLGYSSIGGLNCELMLYKGLSYSNIRQAADDGAKIVNASWSSPIYLDAYQADINYVYNKGVLVVAAGSTTDYCKYPACYDHVIAVGGTDQNDNKADDSGYYDKIDICAPSEGIMAPFPGGLHDEYQPRYATSSAAPIITGVCGLILATDNDLNPDEVEFILKYTADPIDHLPGNAPYVGKLGAGRVNAYKALRKAASVHLQNTNITGSKTYTSNYDIYAGENILNPLNIGVSTIKAGSVIIFDAEEIILDRGFEVELGASFETR